MKTIADLFPTDGQVSKDLLRKGLAGPVVNVQGYGARGDGRADDRNAFAAAAAQAAGDALLIPSGRYRIGDDIAFGPKAGLCFLPGAVIAPDAGATISIDGAVDAGAWQIFDVADAQAIRGAIKAPFILPQWFGAVTDDPEAAARNVKAFRAAWATLPRVNGLMLIPSGAYYVDDTVKFGDTVAGSARDYHGTRILGQGTIVALEAANFSGKPVVHLESVEIDAGGLCVDAGRTQTARSPAVGLAVTRNATHKGAVLTGTIDISGAYTHAAYYNVACENCHLQNSTIRNHGTGAVMWDGAQDLPGLSLGVSDSNTRKSFRGCNFLSYSGHATPAVLVRTGWIAEFAFTNCYFYMDNGKVFSDEGHGVEVHNLLVRECRCEVNVKRPPEITAANRFLYVTHRLTGGEIAYVNFESPADALIGIDGGIVASFHVAGNSVGIDRKKVGAEIRIDNGGYLSDLTGTAQSTIEVRNGTGKSYLIRADISSTADPPVAGDGIYGLAYGNRLLSWPGLYEKGPPRAQGQIESLQNDAAAGPKAFKVAGSTAFYTTGDSRIAWLDDTFTTHTITLLCADGSIAVERNAQPTPPGYRPIVLAAGEDFHGTRGTTLVLQNGYGGWREIGRVAELRSATDWRPGGADGLRVGGGDVSPTIAVPGAEFGDVVGCAAPYDLQGAVATAYVAAPGTVKMSISNSTAGPIRFEAGRWRVGINR